MDNEEFEEEPKSKYIGLVIFIVSIIAVWIFVSNGHEKEREQYVPDAEPSKETLKKWTKQYYENGGVDPDLDISQQYGGK